MYSADFGPVYKKILIIAEIWNLFVIGSLTGERLFFPRIVSLSLNRLGHLLSAEL